VHWAEVRVHAASINARHVLFGPYLSARCDRISQGDSKLARILETERKGMCVCQYETSRRPQDHRSVRVRIRQLVAGKVKDGYFALLTLRTGLSGHVTTTFI
jgi:hypothetical protein